MLAAGRIGGMRFDACLASEDFAAAIDRDIQTPRNASCTALTDVVTLRVGKDDFWKVMREQPNFTIEVMKVVIDRYVTR